MLDALLTPGAAALYQRIVGGERVCIARGTDTDPEAEGTPASELARVGLVKRLPVDPDLLLAVDPTVALAVGIRPLLDGVIEGITAINDTARDIDLLAGRSLAVRGHRSAEVGTAELLHDKNDISVRHASMTDIATSEILAFATHSTLTGTPPRFLSPSEEQRERGLVTRTVYSAGLFHQLERAGMLHCEDESCRVLRIAANLPIKMKIVDRREAMVGLDETGLRVALHVREPAAISALCMLFESVWERAIPYRGESKVLTPREHQLLMLMATGEKDEAIAKKLGVGVRTVRRHISSAMQKLGTESRFAAGVQAVKRGWL